MLIGIHGYPAEDAKAWREELGTTFTLAADTSLVVMKAYELYNKKNLPHPTTIIIDQAGIIRFREVHENYKQRTAVERVLAVLERL